MDSEFIISGKEQILPSFPIGKIDDIARRVKVLEVTPATSAWGGITGTLSSQTDLQNALNAKANSLGADDNYVTDAQLVVIGNTSGTNTGDNATNTQYSGLATSKENTITAGATTQYWRGDKTWQTKDRLLFTHFVNAGNDTTLETDLYSDSITTGTFVTNGDLIFSKTTGSFAGSGTATRQLRAYFATVLIFDTGALSIAGNSDWRMEMSIIRVSNTVVRCSVALNTGGASTSVYTKFTEITALNLTTTVYTLKSTGTASGVGASTNDIVAKMGSIEYKNNI